MTNLQKDIDLMFDKALEVWNRRAHTHVECVRDRKNLFTEVINDPYFQLILTSSKGSLQNTLIEIMTLRDEYFRDQRKILVQPLLLWHVLSRRYTEPLIHSPS